VAGPTTTEVEIECCVPCGLLEPDQRTQAALLTELGDRLDAVALVPGGGIVQVRVDAATVFDGQGEDGDRADVVARVADHLCGEAPA
jgi:selenoprotein W-related protein